VTYLNAPNIISIAHDATIASICVIDDNDDVRKFTCRVLHDAGYMTAEAPDGLVGVRLVRALRPALVITDLLMPEQDGLETISVLKAEMPLLPILAISGGGTLDGAMLVCRATCKTGFSRTIAV
jgi:CheY-like chemotaxis protein